MWKKILYVTDFSEASENAFHHALTMAVFFEAELTLMHVRVPLQDDPHNPRFHFPELDEIYARAEKVARDLLDSRGEEVEKPVVKTRVVRGVEADTAILREVESEGYDLVVMGTHGRRGLNQLVMGSVTQGVVQQALVSVYTVRMDVVHPDPELPYRRILIPGDLSSGSGKAVQHAVEVARRASGAVTVLHVVTKESPEDPTVTLQDLVRPYQGEKITFQTRTGVPEEAILQAAREISADLIVMAKKGQTALEYVLLGSTTERIIRTAPCPVISVAV